jgi:hypothetical protein
LAIEEINRAGGIIGREIEVIAYDPGSVPETYRKLADRLLTEDGASVIFGCSTSAERKAVLPAIERRNGLLWYPSLYEGFEYSPNVIYTGACPNQNSFPLAEYIVRKYGPRVYLIGSDYIYPRESNRIMRDLVESYAGQVAGEQYVPMEASDEAMSPLRRRMIEDMTIRKFAPKTQHDYVQRVKNFAAFLGRSSDTASFELEPMARCPMGPPSNIRIGGHRPALFATIDEEDVTGLLKAR